MPVTRAERSDDGPTDRLTRLAGEAAAAIEASPEATGGECGIVLLSEGGEGGNVMFGFEDDGEALRFLLAHVEAICKASGRAFRVVMTGIN